MSAAGAQRARACITYPAALIQLAAGLAMIILVARKLYKIEFDSDERNFTEVSCALDKASVQGNSDSDEDSLCKLAYIGNAITFAVLVGLSLLLCLSCGCCGGPLESIISVIAYAVLAVGWTLYSSWVTDSARAIDDWDGVQPPWNDDEVQNARTAVVILSWVQALMFAILAVITFLTGCCCGDGAHGGRSPSKR